MDYHFDTPAFNNLINSYYDLCYAEKALKRARRRARLVRTVEKTVLIVGVAAVINHIKN